MKQETTRNNIKKFRSKSVVAAGLMSLAGGGSFENNFHTIFRISAAFLAGSALVHAANGSKVTAGANGLFNGYVESSKPLFGFSGGATLGPVSSYSGAGPSGTAVAGGTLGAHEFGHTVQFGGHSAAAGAFAPNESIEAAYGSYLLFNSPGFFSSKIPQERGISWLGGMFL